MRSLVGRWTSGARTASSPVGRCPTEGNACQVGPVMAPPLTWLSGNLVLQVLTQPAADLVGVLVPVHGHGMLGGCEQDLVLLTRNGQCATVLARKVSAISNLSAHVPSPFLRHISSTRCTSRLRKTGGRSHSSRILAERDVVSGSSELAMAPSYEGNSTIWTYVFGWSLSLVKVPRCAVRLPSVCASPLADQCLDLVRSGGLDLDDLDEPHVCAPSCGASLGKVTPQEGDCNG